MQAGFNLSLVWRDKLIKNTGFVEDEEVPTGWIHPSVVGSKDEELATTTMEKRRRTS